MKYVPEPFKIKMVEPIKMTTMEERKEIIAEAHHNLFLVKSDDVYIDFCTDSGTGAMSDKQWSSIMIGDEAYAGGRSYQKLLDAITDIFDYKYGQPVHQGRAAEKVLFNILVGDDKVSLSNMHFDTTRAHVQLAGAKPIDIICKEGKDIVNYHPFKGNIDLVKLEELIAEYGADRVGMIVMTITNNSAGGQPVSMANLKAASAIAKKNGITLVIDAARFAENAFFIKEREEGYADTPMKEIVREMFSYADAFTMSAKKDAIVNMGGLVGVKEDAELYESVKAMTIPNEGFVTYGGLAGRDLEALAVGLYEGIEYDYLKYRIGQIQYMGEKLREAGIALQYPVGGHGLFLDAAQILPHIPYFQFPAMALANELYVEAGIRGGDIGSFNMGTDPKTGEQIQAEFEFCRLAVPRRVYTQAHFDMVIDAIISVRDRAQEVKGYEITWQPKVLRHFTAHLDFVK